MGIIAGVLFAGGYITHASTSRSGWCSRPTRRSRLGTLSGGWRIIHTMGSKITRLQPVGGFAAETAGAVVALHGHRRSACRSARRTRSPARSSASASIAAAVGRPLGRRRPDRVGVGADDSGLGGHRRRHLLPAGGRRPQLASAHRAAAGGSGGSRTAKRAPPPGAFCDRDRCRRAGRPGASRWPGRGRCRRAGRATCRRGRSARRRGRDLRAECPGRCRSPSTASTSPAHARRRPRTSPPACV